MCRLSVVLNHVYLAQISTGNTLVERDKSQFSFDNYGNIKILWKIVGENIVGTVKILVQVFHEDE